MDLRTAPNRQGTTRPATSPPDDAAAAFAYQPALDGLRAVAVSMVLVFHAGFGWLPGGYVGVSVFFTLSGYLITSLALAEHDHTGRLDVGAFYGRRIRRLLPASLTCIATVMVAAWFHQFGGVTQLRRDLWAALVQLYNWFALADGESYGEQLARAVGQRGPLDHYWSLAIEEQFYWVWPLVLVVVLRLGARRRVLVVGALTALAAGAAVVIANVFGPAAAYFATPARLPEILVGALAAVVLHERDRTGRPHVPGAIASGLVGLLVVVAAAVAWPAQGGPAYGGWLPLFAMAAAAVIIGLQPPSMLRRALAVRPLVQLGRISYGVYLFHWPVYTLVDERRLDIGRVGLFAVRVAITLAAAALCFAILEQPIRRWRLALVPTLSAAAGVCVVVAVAVFYVPDRGGTYSFVADETRTAARIPDVTPNATLEPLAVMGGSIGARAAADVELSRAARAMIIGDSTAYSTGEGLIQWAAEHPTVLRVTARAAVGCGLNATGLLPDDGFREACDAVRNGIVGVVEATQPDVVVAMVTFRDMEDRMWLAAEGELTPTDVRFRGHLLDGYEAITRRLLDAGAGRVVWVIAPTPALPAVGDLAPMLEPDRIEAYRRVVRALPLSFPGLVSVADMAAWMEAHDDPPRRFDGLHWTLDAAVRVADEFLVPTVLGAALTPE